MESGRAMAVSAQLYCMVSCIARGVTYMNQLAVTVSSDGQLCCVSNAVSGVLLGWDYQRLPNINQVWCCNVIAFS
jgi:hypothetical protein